jgi:hypothetical protein
MKKTCVEKQLLGHELSQAIDRLYDLKKRHIAAIGSGTADPLILSSLKQAERNQRDAQEARRFHIEKHRC